MPTLPVLRTYFKSMDRRRAGKLSALAVAVLAIVWGGMALLGRLDTVYEYDARVSGKVITVSSRVAGWVVDRPVRQGSTVKKGDVLVKIDDRESRIMKRNYEARITGVNAELAKLQAERRLIDRQTQSRLEAQTSELQAAKAEAEAAKAELELAREEAKRAESLFKRKVISRQRLDRARSELSRLRGELRAAQAKQESAKATLEEVTADRDRLMVIDQEVEMLKSRREELRLLKEQQELDLEDRVIKSMVNGVVDQTFVEPGEYVNAGQRLVMVHDPGNIWVDANIKETEIRDIKPGQTVRVHVDAYPGETFRGTVEAVGNTTTGKFALLPNPNPSGNFTKITQRIPVRIAVEQENGKLRPGMLVEVEIETD